MDSINDFMFSLAKYPGILGELILEEGQQLNQQIKDNITKLNIFPVEYNEFIPEFLASIILTLSLSTLVIFTIIYWTSKGNKTNRNVKMLNMNQKNKSLMIKKGFYLQSIDELNAASKDIVKKFEKGQIYCALIRVQMKDYIKMVGKKLDSEMNNIDKDKSANDETFLTKDLYFIMKFKIINKIKNDSLVGNVIVHFMNDFNHDKYITNDFVVCAIGTSANFDPTEFHNGLKHTGYEMKNAIYINKRICRLNIISYYCLLLPTHQIHNLFMDVYNNCVFESSKYSIDKKNRETWNDKPIKQLSF
jgi:hypothetical protein